MFDIISDLWDLAIDLLGDHADSVADAADVSAGGGVAEMSSGGGSAVHFGSSPSGISDDTYAEPVSWSNSFQGYFGDNTGRPMEPR